ncbi:unnamed protein product [Symbiodinium sp. CCMP2592]|nr:unnamed protein product [Symbiodinium sp. CCMP2592]
MASNLFDASDRLDEDKKEEKKERRTKLYSYDAVAAQMLEPYGESSLDSLNLEQIWKGTAKGNKSTTYHSHLAANPDGDAWHVGAGLSQTAAALLMAIKNFKSENMKQLIVPKIYEKVLEEIKELEPTLHALNFGKGSSTHTDTGSFRQAKKAKWTSTANIETPAEPMDPLEAAVKFRAWLAKDKSALRGLLFVLSGNNTYYTGHTAELVARAAVHCKPMSEQDFINAVKARMQKPEQSEGSKAASADPSGLFDA